MLQYILMLFVLFKLFHQIVKTFSSNYFYDLVIIRFLQFLTFGTNP